MPSKIGECSHAVPSTTMSRVTPLSAGTASSVDLGSVPESSSELTPQNCPDPYDYIQEFFCSKSQTLQKHKDHTSSASTREPAFFDRHLDPQLQLDYVVYLPSITADLMKIADDAVEAARLGGTLPTSKVGFPHPRRRLAALRSSPVNKIICEEQIELIYNLNTAEFCSTVAATLEFQLPAWGKGHLLYTLERDKARAIADGLLKLDGTANDSAHPLSAAHALVADTFPTLALWEFKSLTAGTVDVMEAIVQQTVGSMAFPWEGCELGKTCVGDAKHREKNGSPKVTGCRMGYDALAESPAVSIVDDSTTRTPGVPSRPLSDKARISAARITQQTWAEAVHDDVTFVVIHAGNFEIIGKRNRGKRTLYLSDVIKVDECDYWRLHTGLYIAALRDATSRALQLQTSNPPASWMKSYGKQLVTKMAPADILAQASVRDWFLMQCSPKKMPPVGFILNAYHFRDNPSKELKHQTARDLRSFFRITLSAQLDHFIARGTLEVDGNQLTRAGPTISNTMIVKVAHTDDAIAKLHREHGVYLDLLRAGVTGLPHIFGFFNWVDIERAAEDPLPCAVLVMEDVGRPVDQVSEHFTRSHLTLFQELLKKVHQAGFVHTKLSRKKLMIRSGEPGGVSIVSFGSAHKLGQGQAHVFDDEYRSLLGLLPNPLRRTADGEPTDSFKRAFPTVGTSNIREDKGDLSSPPSPVREAKKVKRGDSLNSSPARGLPKRK